MVPAPIICPVQRREGLGVLTKEQSAAARALLGLKQRDLAELAGLSESTVRNFEKGRSDPSAEALAAIGLALEKAGVQFIAENGGGAGVRFSRPGKKAATKTGAKGRGRK